MALPAEVVSKVAERCGLKVWDSFLERASCDKKEVYLNGGWRGGKSASAAFLCFVQIFLYFLRTPGDHLIWLVGPDYDQARPEFGYLGQWSVRLGLAVETSTAMQGSLHMTISWPGKPGIVHVQTKSAKDPTSLGSVPPSFIIACEAGQISGEAHGWIEGRTAEKNATVVWAGTFENEEGKAQYAWFEEDSERVSKTPGTREQAFSLPSWENEYVFGNCLEGENGITRDKTLAVWCPDENHGAAHSGLNHPKIRELQYKWRFDQIGWRKKFGGEAVGIRNPVYGWAQNDKWDDIPNNHYLIPMPAELKQLGRWLRTAGGMDFGLGDQVDDGHPSSITICSIVNGGPYDGQTWVRHSLVDSSGSIDWIWATKKALTRSLHVTLWGADPQVKYNPTYLDVEAMSGANYSREARVGWVRSVQLADKLFFDSDDPGVVLLFREMQRVRRAKGANGKTSYVRDEDDMTASFEDAIAMLHGSPIADIPPSVSFRRFQRRAQPVPPRVRI